MTKYFYSVYDGNAESDLKSCKGPLSAFRKCIKSGFIKPGDTIKLFNVDLLSEFSYHRFFIYLPPYFLCYHDSRKNYHIYSVGDDNEVQYS